MGFNSGEAAHLPTLRARLKEAAENSGEIARILQEAGPCIGERGYTTMIVTCGRMGSWQKAMEVFESMGIYGVAPNSYTYGALISVLYSANEWQQALNMFFKMQQDGCLVDQLVYKHVMQVCIKLGEFDLVLKLYREIRKEAIELEGLIAASVLTACMRKREWEVAADMLDVYHASNKILSHKLYTQIVGACADHGDVDKALEFFIMMQMVGVHPNSYSCQNMMRAIESAGCVDLGVQFHQEMKESRMFLNDETYNLAVRLYARAGEWGLLLNLATTMMLQAVQISTESKEVILRSYSTHTTSQSMPLDVAWKIKRLGISVEAECNDWQIRAGSHISSASPRRFTQRHVQA